jgi:hypothetical protein
VGTIVDETTIEITGGTIDVGDVIEVGNDSIHRTVDAVVGDTHTISPALSPSASGGVLVQDWGPGATDLDTDLDIGSASMCIDAGSNDAVPADRRDLDGDGDVFEPLPYDIARDERFIDDPATVDTGLGTAPIVDIGAYEYAP